MKCGVCDEEYEELEACSTCYSTVWGAMARFQDVTSTEAVDSLLSSLNVEFKAEKPSKTQDVIYTVSRADGLGPAGRGTTRALAVADLFAQMLVTKCTLVLSPEVKPHPKFTRNFINQLPDAQVAVLRMGKGIGYVRNVRKGMAWAAIVEHEGKYYVIEGNWQKGETAWYCKRGKWRTSLKFGTKEACESGFEQYSRVLQEARIAGQIFA